MSRRSSRSSRSTRWYSTPKLAQAGISLVFADSVQVSTSPGSAAATLPRQSSPLQSNDGFPDMNTLDNNGVQDDTSSGFSRSSNSLLPSMYSSKRRQNSAVIPRVERVIQPKPHPHSEAMSSDADKSRPSNMNNTGATSLRVPVTNPLPMDSVPPSLNPVSTQTSGLGERTTSESSLSRSILNSKMFRKSTERCVSNLANKSPSSTKPDSPADPVNLPAEPEQTSATDPLAQNEISEIITPTDPAIQSDHDLNRPQDDSIHTTDISATSTGDNNAQRNETSNSLSYIPSYLLPRQMFSPAGEKKVESEVRTEEIPSHSVSLDKKDAAHQVPEEEAPDGTLPKSFSTETPAASSTTAWSHYLKFPISIVPGFRSSSSDAIILPVSPKPDESHSDTEVISPVPSSGESWLMPWLWWRSNSPSNSTIEPSSAAVSPEIESSQRDMSSEPINPILANRETKAGWLSVLASTNARRRAVKEQGEIMEVVIVDEEPLVQTKQSSESITSKKRDTSAAPSTMSAKSQEPEFLVLPTFEDTFWNPPRSIPLPKEVSTLYRTVNYVAKMLFNEDSKDKGKGKEKGNFGKELPRTWSVLGEDPIQALGKIKRVVVVGIHGWFPGAFIRQVLGEPTGTSEKFAAMLEKTVREYFDEHGVVLEKVTKIILQGGGTVAQRVESLFQEYLSHEDWVNDLQTADAILFGTHSQGSIVTTQIVDRLIEEGHIRTPSSSLLASLSAPQHVGILALCGVHNGPFLHLNNNYLMNPYIQYFESAAARELFDFQDSESPVSKTYVTALSKCLHHGVKFTYIASLNDQVVPIYSGAFVTATHPLILRALYIDGDAYHSTDFLSNLLILLFKVRNAGLSDSGLIAHLSEATAGSLTGVGHSKAYEALASYRLAVRFLFETSGVIGSDHDLIVEPFTARAARNDYEIPWALRDLIANTDVSALFASDFSSLRTALDEWHPRTAVLRDIRRKLEPIRRLNTARL